MDSDASIIPQAAGKLARSLSGNHAQSEPQQQDDRSWNKPAAWRKRGLLIVSLDFEQIWGVRHLSSGSGYIDRIIAARPVIPALLSLFKDYGIHATWAVVGFLFADNGAALRKYIPGLIPKYADAGLSPYSDLPPAQSCESRDSVFFAPSLIRQIQASPHQEIGTHTLSHYYCLEPGQDLEAFRADLNGATRAAADFGITLKSLVFPKNQCHPDYLGVCAEAGIIAYRGTPDSWMYRAKPDREQRRAARRLGRLLDSYLPLSSTLSARLPLKATRAPLDVPASRLLRPYMPALGAFEALRFLRIKREMTQAARSGRLYHLWWHPHDFGANTKQNLTFLRRILDHYLKLRDAYGFESLNMMEAATEFLDQSKARSEADCVKIMKTGTIPA